MEYPYYILFSSSLAFSNAMVPGCLGTFQWYCYLSR